MFKMKFPVRVFHFIFSQRLTCKLKYLSNPAPPTKQSFISQVLASCEHPQKNVFIKWKTVYCCYICKIYSRSISGWFELFVWEFYAAKLNLFQHPNVFQLICNFDSHSDGIVSMTKENIDVQKGFYTFREMISTPFTRNKENIVNIVNLDNQKLI